MPTTDAAPAPVLLAEGLGVRLGDVAILEEVDLALAPGDLTLLVGPNGAGKSTLLRALAGLLPASGDVRVAGHLPGSTAARATFAFAPDEPALYEDLTLAEHARFTAALYQRPETEARARALLDAFDLGTKLDEVPGSHSRGMRQKLGLALALGLAMPLTMLDEPFNGLDADAQATLARALVERAADGGAVLLTGHQQELPTTLGARVLALRGGHVVPEA